MSNTIMIRHYGHKAVVLKTRDSAAALEEFTECDCAAPTEDQGFGIRTLADLNAFNRRLYGQRPRKEN